VAPVRHSAGATFICEVRSIYADHNARSLDYCGDLAARFDAEFFHGFIRNGGGDTIAAADIDHEWEVVAAPFFIALTVPLI
jgi:hypothetical protein